MKAEKGWASGSTVMLVLSLLGEQDMYGYQMIAELERRSEKVFSMKEGTLYPVLHALEQDGAVESYLADSTAGKKRKYYRITPRGNRLLQEKRKEWQRFCGAVKQVMGGLCREG
ncbi:MAG: PadR family transcriptional regulator [Oscillospiraceae bacterium]|nr:PadR family transcriptional regulator [Oscillospiraceae bacterium]MDY4191835.1 PadR family transcriptional regulator [Oscillospiraceae bacterium]